MLESPGDTTLDAARAGDRAAVERIVDFCTPLIFAWCGRKQLPRANWDDVTQDVSLALCRDLSRFQRRGEGDFIKWLYTITRHKIIDRQRHRDGALDPVGGTDFQQRIDAVPAPEELSSFDLSDARKLLYQRALQLGERRFEPQTWRAFWMVVVDERNPDEVAQELGMARNSVDQAKSRVLKTLRKELHGLAD
jgi:RNA polymerase sigma-70 factor, ECF subfamily